MATQPDLNSNEREPTPAERIRAITAKMRRTMPNACGDWAAEIDQALADMEGCSGARRAQSPSWIERKVRKDTDEYRAYLSARFPRGGAPSPFDFDGHKWRYHFTSFDDLGEFDVIARPADEPVQP